MSRPTSRSWFRVVLATAIFVAIVVVQFRLLSWSLSLIVGGTAALGSVPISAVAAFVAIMIAVCWAVFVADGWRGFRIFPVIARLSSNERRLFVIFGVAMLIVISVVQASAIYLAPIDAVAAGRDIAPPLDLVPGLSFAIGELIRTALGCLLPICMIASVFVLVSQIVGPFSPAGASRSESEPTVTRL